MAQIAPRGVTSSHDPSQDSPTVLALVLVFCVAVLLQLLFAHSYDISLRMAPIPTSSSGAGVSMGLEAISEGSMRRRLGMIALGFLGGILMFRSRHRSIELTPFAGWAAAMFLAWSTISIVWAVEPSLVGRRLIAFWLLICATVGIVRWAPPRSIPWYLSLSAAFFIIVGLAVELRLGTFAPSPSYRFSGTLHPNAQGINCAILVLSSSWIAVSGGRRNRIMGIALGLAGLLFLIMTRSRTSFAATVGAWLVLVVLRLHPRRRWIVAAALVNVAILMVMLYVNGFLDPLLELMLLGRGDKDVGTLNSRMPLWQILTPYLAQRPVTGFGFAGFMTVQHAMEIALLLEFGIAGAHSLYLEVALGTGIVGMLLFVATLIGAFGHGAWQSFGPRLGTGVSLLAAIVAFELVNGVLDSSLVFPAWRFSSLLVITALCLQRPDEAGS